MTSRNLLRSRSTVYSVLNNRPHGAREALLVFACLLLVSASFAFAASPIAPAFGKLPLSFEPNRGQADPRVQFVSRGPGFTLYLAPGEALLTGTADVLDMRLLGANLASAVNGLEPQPGVVNYVAGSDPKRWHSGIPTYAKVTYNNIYPGVDLVFYGNQRQLEYDFAIAPGADPKQIVWKIAGAALKLDSEGNLLFQAHGPASFQRPFVYQMVNGLKVAIDAHYAIAGDQVRFAVGRFDRSRPLIIDPVLSYATYLGGAVNQSSATDGYTTIGAFSSFYPSGVNNPTQGIAVDSQGDAYVTGYTNSTSFPLQNPSQGSAPGIVADYNARAAFVTKFNPQGTGLVYSTYLGGTSDAATNATSIAVDTGGNAYVAGYTNDGTFPVTSGAYQTICGAYFNGTARANGCGPEAQTSGFVTKLDPAGMPVYSTFLGAASDVISAIAVDASGQAYEAGTSNDYCTSSQPAYYCFPTTSNAILPGTASYVYQPSTGSYGLFTGMAFLSVLDVNGASLLYSTYVGDNTALIASGAVASSTWGQSTASAVTVDSAGEFFLAGVTAAPNLPTSTGAYLGSPTLVGCCMGYVAKFAPVSSGASLDYLTYLAGTVNGAFPSGIVADSAGEAYVAGLNEDQNFPTTSGAYQTSCGATGNGRCNNAFVTKFNMAGTGLLWSTMLGNPLNGQGVAVSTVGPIQLDSTGNVYVTGTSSGAFADFPQVNPVQPSTGGNSQPFVTEFNPTGSSILFSTFFGSGGTSGLQAAAGLALDSIGNIYLAGNTTATGVAVTPGAFQQNFLGTGDGYLAKICMVLPCGQAIGFGTLPNVTYGVSAITLGATASSGLPVTYMVTGPASVNGSTLTITGAGRVGVTASQSGNTTYSAAAPVTQSFTVSPAVLTVTADSPSIVTGQPIPPLTYGLSGFVNADTAAAIGGTPSESTTATAGSTAGNYPVTITLRSLSSTNYSFTLVNGTLTIGAFTACDVNDKGRTDVSDVKAFIDEALGVASPQHSLQGGGAVNIVDVQIALNSALSLGCSRS